MTEAPPPWIAYAAIALLVLGLCFSCAIWMSDDSSRPRQWFARYEARLDEELRFLMADLTGRRLMLMQLAALSGTAVVGLALGQVLFAAMFVALAAFPLLELNRKRKDRVQKLEKQLDSWLLLVANALKAAPSLGEALEASSRIARPPVKEEVDLVLKELRLGTPLDVALMNMSARVRSPVVSGALTALVVGRRTGGNLPELLEASSATLREMARIEGVIRTKTAEGKMQAAVLAFAPFVVVGMLHSFDPTMLQVLTDDPTGWILLIVATLLWMGALVFARKLVMVTA